jgi:hypothetical protein
VKNRRKNNFIAERLRTNSGGPHPAVMPGLAPGIHAALLSRTLTICSSGAAWMAGTSPAMTVVRLKTDPFPQRLWRGRADLSSRRTVAKKKPQFRLFSPCRRPPTRGTLSRRRWINPALYIFVHNMLCVRDKATQGIDEIVTKA